MDAKAFDLIKGLYTDFYSNKISVNDFQSRLSQCLGAIQLFSDKKYKFHVSVYHDTMKHSFFGINIFPDFNGITNVLSCMHGIGFADFGRGVTSDIEQYLPKFDQVVSKWRECEDWYIEIDLAIFKNPHFFFTPNEFLTMLLFEIGHVAFNDHMLETIFTIFREFFLKMNDQQKALSYSMCYLYAIPVYTMCQRKMWNHGNVAFDAKNLCTEMLINEYQIVEELQAAYNKIRVTYGMNISVDDKNLMYNDFEWCYRNIINMDTRKHNLKDDLYIRTINSNSKFVGKCLVKVLDNLGFSLRERYTGYCIENSLEIIKSKDFLDKYAPEFNTKGMIQYDRSTHAAMESFKIFNRRKKLKVTLPSQYDVDNIGVKVGSITNHHDRTFVLDLLYETYDRVNIFEEAVIASGDEKLREKWQPKINQMKKELDGYRKEILEKRTFKDPTKFNYLVQLDDVAADYRG